MSSTLAPGKMHVKIGHFLCRKPHSISPYVIYCIGIKDFAFWPLRTGSKVLVVWIPLVPVRKENGTLSVAIGSHRCQVGPIVNLSTGIVDDCHEEDSAFDISGLDIVCLELGAGDGVVFHANMYHMSHPNLTDRARAAWSSVWVHPDAQWDPSRVPNHPRSKEVTQGAKIGQFEWERMRKCLQPSS